MTRPRNLSVLAAFIGVVCFAQNAQALCNGDTWAAKYAIIVPISSSQIIVDAGSHPSCFGDLQAKVRLVNTSCQSGWAYETHDNNQSNESVNAVYPCSVSCGPFYWFAAGEFDWNAEQDWQYAESLPYRAPCDCDPPSGGCSIEGCVWSYYDCDCVDCCPLVFDTSGKGYKLTSADRGVWFDINADGQQDNISWTDPRRDVGFLVFDRNGNGLVDDGEELFGNVTPLPPGSTRERASHGFDALASLEDDAYGTSIKDGIIDRNDAAYDKLLLWIDRSHDGLSQAGELQKASDAGLIAIETRYRESKRRDEFGNEFRLRGIRWWQRENRLIARLFYDVWFVPNR